MSERGEPFPVGSIYPNRLNPNEMDRFDVDQLRNDIEVDDYDPITVSPLDVFYDAKARMDPRVTEIIPMDADGMTTYIICDGYHRHTAASQIGLTHIRAVIRHMTEPDAMAHFYRRHKLRGQLEPLKEAELFRHEMERGLTRAEVVKRYNLSNANYIKTRLTLLNVTTDVVDLYYEPPEPDLPGRLSISHLRSLSFIPKNLQFAVAMMSLERNWSIGDMRAEVRRIKEGQGTSQARTEAPDAPPPSHPTIIQRHLHPNVTRLLNPNEEKVVRYIKKEGEVMRTGIVENIGISNHTAGKILRDLLELEVLTSRKQERKQGEGAGRKPDIFRLKEIKPEPKSEYARKTPLTDEELLKQYPEAFKETTTKETTTVKERQKERVSSGVFEEGQLVGEPRVEPESPEAWREREVSDRLIPMKQPPLVLDQALVEDFAEEIYKMAIRERFNIKGKELIDGQEPGQWLENEIRADLEEWFRLRTVGKRDFRNLVAIGLRACQLYHRHREM